MDVLQTILSVIAGLSAIAAPVSPERTVEDCERAATFEVVGNEVVMDGEIDEDTEDRLFDMLERNPHVTTLVLRCVPGSNDDEANVQLGLRVNRSGLTVRVPDFRANQYGEPVEGLIASGGVDLFLAGQQRLLGANACVGIHSWSDDDYEGRDLPEDHEDHEMFIEYYEEIGFPDAAGFYFLTLEVAPADGMYYMTASELREWDVAAGATGQCPLEN